MKALDWGAHSCYEAATYGPRVMAYICWEELQRGNQSQATLARLSY